MSSRPLCPWCNERTCYKECGGPPEEDKPQNRIVSVTFPKVKIVLQCGHQLERTYEDYLNMKDKHVECHQCWVERNK